MIMGIDATLKELRELQEKGEKARQEAQHRLQELRQKIEGGESTGDHITDFVVLRYEGSTQAQEKLHTLESQLRRHEGDIVLVQDSYRTVQGQTGCFTVQDITYLTTLSFGKVAQPFLRLGQKLEINQYDRRPDRLDQLQALRSIEEYNAEVCVAASLIIRNQGLFENSIDLREGPKIGTKKIYFDTSRFLLGEQSPICKPYPLDRDDVLIAGGIAIAIGSDAVQAYLKPVRFTVHNQKAWGVSEYYLNGGELFPRIQELVVDDRKREQYLAAQKQAQEEERRGKVDVLVLELLDQKYARGIGGLGNVRTVQEARQKLEEGMKLQAYADDRIIQPHVGVNLNVKEFFRNLCEIYKVEITE